MDYELFLKSSEGHLQLTECRFCTLDLPSYEQRKWHEQRHIYYYICKHCKKVFEGKTTAQAHQKDVSGHKITREVRAPRKLRYGQPLRLQWAGNVIPQQNCRPTLTLERVVQSQTQLPNSEPAQMRRIACPSPDTPGGHWTCTDPVSEVLLAPPNSPVNQWAVEPSLGQANVVATDTWLDVINQDVGSFMDYLQNNGLTESDPLISQMGEWEAYLHPDTYLPTTSWLEEPLQLPDDW